jgi:hypothetical protein
MHVKTFKVKGTRYYDAKAEVSAKRAREKSEVKLQRDPANQYDSHAVRVLLAQNGAFLGYVPQSMSAHVSSQILAGVIKKAHIRSITKNSDYLEIKVTYEFDGPVELPPRRTSPPVYVPSNTGNLHNATGSQQTPVTPTTVSTRYTPSPATSPKSSSSWCFIASQVYGPASWETNVLRQWRDEKLLSTAVGRRFVVTYYQVSPPIARMLSRSPLLERLTRRILDKVVNLVKK